jgi:hypothetical protein
MEKNLTALLERADEAIQQHDSFMAESARHEKIRRVPTTADYLSLELPEIQYLVGDWAAEGAPVLISGPTKCGKTLFVYSLLHAISIGEPFLGWDTPPGGASVAIVDGEMRPQTIKRRLQAITKHSARLGNLKIITREFFLDRDRSFPDLSKKEDREILLTEISPPDDPVRLVVFDNINCIFKGDENQPGYWNQIEDLIKSCRRRKIATWLVHHNPKSRPDAPAGSSKAERFPEVVIVLQKIGAEAGQAAHFNIKFRHCRDLSATATDASARFEDATGWVVDKYLPQELRLGCDPISRRQEALSLLSTGKSWQAVAEQTGISRAGVYRLKKELPK